ncbi:unnamed protein product [Cylicocyclus nassatus]|uniref:Uncharacterized protein n=1 Tax=Cylicocyclus nassatus TaxID=53992 RepID=A0AA36DNX0_CYLNA|nr:unnamed protein product [Cylicocyclus nassatus]
MVSFWSIEKKYCGLKQCSQSIGVWAYECCGTLNQDCCGAITLSGWLAIGVVGALLVVIIVTVVCKK